MTNPSMAECKEHGLLIDAKERYENTSKRWKNAWWDVICYIYDHFEQWHENFHLDPIAKGIVELTKKRKSRSRYDIREKETVCIRFAKGTKLCYLFKFYDSNGNLLYSKVGTTERTIRERLAREISDYRKGGHDVGYAVIESVINTSFYHPEGAESYVRAMFIKKFNDCFIKNDRFTCDIDTNEFNKMVTSYLAA